MYYVEEVYEKTVFLCIPTPYSEDKNTWEISASSHKIARATPQERGLALLNQSASCSKRFWANSLPLTRCKHFATLNLSLNQMCVLQRWAPLEIKFMDSLLMSCGSAHVHWLPRTTNVGECVENDLTAQEKYRASRMACSNRNGVSSFITARRTNVDPIYR